MQIQVNTDANIKGREELIEHVEAEVHHSLGHFADQIMRVEVHLIDENGPISGGIDKRCLMEARRSGHQPVAVSDEAATLQDAIHGAAKKLHKLLESTLERQGEHKGGESIRTDDRLGGDV